MRLGRFQRAAITSARTFEATFEARLETAQATAGLRVVVVFFQPIERQRRYQGSRQHVRGQHRKDHRFGQRREKVFGDAAEKEDRHKDDTDRQRRNQRRHGDLMRAFQDRVVDLLAFLQMRVDVFDGHGCIVDEDADRQRQTTERHDVDGFAQRRERDDRGENRQRNRYRDDQGGAPGAEKQQDHQARQRCGDDAFADHAGYCRTHEQRLVGDRLDLQVFRNGGANARQHVAQRVDDIEGGGIADFQDGHQHRTLPVHPHDIGLRRRAVVHVCHVADIGGDAVDGMDRRVVEIADLLRTAVEPHAVFDIADFFGAGGQNQILRANGRHHIAGRQPVRQQCLRVQIHLDLTLLATIRVGRGSAAHRRDKGTHDLVGVIEDGGFGKLFRRQRKLQNGHGGSVVDDDQRRRGALRHGFDRRLRHGGDLRDGHVHVDVRLKKHLHQTDAVERLGLGVLDVVHGSRERTLETGDDAVVHVIGGQAGVLPHDRHHRDIDVRENIGRGTQDCQGPENQ